MSRRKQVNPQHLSLTHREAIPGESHASRTLPHTPDFASPFLILVFKMKNISVESCVTVSVRQWCNREALHPHKLFCGNTFYDVHPRVKHDCDVDASPACF